MMKLTKAQKRCLIKAAQNKGVQMSGAYSDGDTAGIDDAFERKSMIEGLWGMGLLSPGDYWGRYAITDFGRLCLNGGEN